jgi:hypothetical protein
MLHVKLWLRYVMRKMTKWSSLSTNTFRAEPVKESMLWCCLLKVMIMWDAYLIK